MYAGHGDVPPGMALEADSHADRHNFPRKLYDLLQHSSPSVVSWLSDGMSFCVLDEKSFAEDVIPQYFAHSKMASFQRQLNIYGFRRLVAKGNAACAFFHPCFVRGHPELLSSIRRVPKKRLQAADDASAPGSKINNITLDLVTAASLQSNRAGMCLSRGSSIQIELPLAPRTAPVVQPTQNELAQVVEMTDLSDDTPTANALVTQAMASGEDTELPVALVLRPIVAKPPGHANEGPHIEDL